MKPVAWMYYDERKTLRLCQTMPPDDNSFPVYTTPRELSDELFNAKLEILRLQDAVHWLTNHPLRELSDDEIVDIWGCAEYSIDHDYDGAIKFARAILKKASEK